MVGHFFCPKKTQNPTVSSFKVRFSAFSRSRRPILHHAYMQKSFSFSIPHNICYCLHFFITYLAFFCIPTPLKLIKHGELYGKFQFFPFFEFQTADLTPNRYGQSFPFSILRILIYFLFFFDVPIKIFFHITIEMIAG